MAEKAEMFSSRNGTDGSARYIRRYDGGHPGSGDGAEKKRRACCSCSVVSIAGHVDLNI